MKRGVIQNYAGPFFKAFYLGYPAPQNALQWPEWLSLKGPLLLVRGCPRSFELHPMKSVAFRLVKRGMDYRFWGYKAGMREEVTCAGGALLPELPRRAYLRRFCKRIHCPATPAPPPRPPRFSVIRAFRHPAYTGASVASNNSRRDRGRHPLLVSRRYLTRWLTAFPHDSCRADSAHAA